MCSKQAIPEQNPQQTVQRVRRALVRRLSSVSKSIEKTTKSLHEALNAQDLIHTADLIKSNLHAIPKNVSTFTVQDWEKEGKERIISIDPPLSPREYMQKLYKRAHRLIRGLERIKEELEKLKARREELIQMITQYDEGIEVEVLAPKVKKQTKKALVPYRTYLASSGEKILVGKDAKSNDLITFQVAKGEDIWLHADKAAGSHVVIRKIKEEVSHQTLEEAALLAAYFSKRRVIGTQVEITVAKRSDVYRKKGMKPGQVLVRKHSTIPVELDKERIQTILNSSV